MATHDKPLTHLLQKLSLPKPRPLAFRKALQCYLDFRTICPDTPHPQSVTRGISYSKLLQETPETFRSMHKVARFKVESKSRLRRGGSFGGVQGIKSVISGKRTCEFRIRVSESRRAPKPLSSKRSQKLFCDQWPTADFDTEKKPRNRKVNTWQSTDAKEEMLSPWSEEIGV